MKYILQVFTDGTWGTLTTQIAGMSERDIAAADAKMAREMNRWQQNYPPFAGAKFRLIKRALSTGE